MSNVLVACEYSGRVRDAFRALGHEAWSCDVLGPDDVPEAFVDQRWPNYHLEGDVRWFLDKAPGGEPWDLMVAHPPCTHLASSGARWFKDKVQEQEEALDFIRLLMDAPIPRIAIENPIGVISTRIRKPDQIVHPWMFGDPEAKATCWWLKDLPVLVPTDVVEPVYHIGPTGRRYSPVAWRGGTGRHGHDRSLTFPGMARAIAEQWGAVL